jgi:glucose-1-phosphate cytidylyltransferase
MDVVIFCGGRGTRLAEKTDIIPKALVPIGGRPMLWHIMKLYSAFGHNRFILTLGYRGEMIKEYFLKYPWLHSNFEINMGQPQVPTIDEDWNIFFLDTGVKSNTGLRLHMAKDHIKGNTFMVTYGDGLSNINFGKLVDFHNKMKSEEGTIGTISIINPQSRFGVVHHEDGKISKFSEKPRMDEFINIGFMVLERGVFDYMDGSDVAFEDILPLIARDGKLAGFHHKDFWACMDTYKDYVELNSLWADSKPWKIWKD